MFAKKMNLPIVENKRPWVTTSKQLLDCYCQPFFDSSFPCEGCEKAPTWMGRWWCLFPPTIRNLVLDYWTNVHLLISQNGARVFFLCLVYQEKIVKQTWVILFKTGLARLWHNWNLLFKGNHVGLSTYLARIYYVNSARLPTQYFSEFHTMTNFFFCLYYDFTLRF